MAKVVNADKFSNWSWWIGVTPQLKSTVFVRPGFHLCVWMYIVLGNAAYFSSYYGIKGKLSSEEYATVTHGDYRHDGISYARTFTTRLLTWTLANFAVQVVGELI